VRLQQGHLLGAEEAAHQGHGRKPQAVQPDRAEEALDHDQVPAVLDPMQVEELEAAPKADQLEAVPISTWVNLPSHDDPRCMEPIAP
jgi:hypothetical protein